MMVFLKEMLVKRQLQVYFHGCFIFIIFFMVDKTIVYAFPQVRHMCVSADGYS
jgi:hypothetical protein